MKIETGNLDQLTTQQSDQHGWFVGRFIQAPSLLQSEKCEVKWARHPKGRRKHSGPGLTSDVRTIVILLSGHWQLEFPNVASNVELSKPGDYVVYEGTPHESEAIEDSHVMVIRWRERKK